MKKIVDDDESREVFVIKSKFVRPKGSEGIVCMMAPSEGVIDEDGEAIAVKVAMKPEPPSAEEVRSHRLAHQSYRNWCRYYAMCRVDDTRRNASDGGRAYFVPPMGYTHLTKHGEKGGPVLVVHDDEAH